MPPADDHAPVVEERRGVTRATGDHAVALDPQAGFPIVDLGLPHLFLEHVVVRSRR
jgi:hypothetical protein